MENIFYHFTAERFLKNIQKEGLTRGMMLKSLNPPQLIPNKQWITTNPEFEQSWAEGTGRLPYKRNEVRLTLEIPLEEMENCKPWTQMKFLVPEVANDLSAYGDPENWHIFSGRIKPQWITEIEFKNQQITTKGGEMKTIFKYQIDEKSPMKISFPVGSTFIKCELQHGCPQMWFQQPIGESSSEERKFAVHGTGWEIPANHEYLGTWISELGYFVWHLHEIKEIGASHDKGE